MSNVDQITEAHRLQRERGYGARRVAAELGITRELAGQFLAAPDPTAQDPRVAAVTAAIVAMTPGAIESNTMVTVTHRYTRAGRQLTDTWTGRPERIAERAVEALEAAEAVAS